MNHSLQADQIFALVRQLVGSRYVPETMVKSFDQCHLILDLGMDSLDVTELCFELEDVTSVRIPEEAIAQGGILVISELVAYIAQAKRD